jgi:peptidoglycan/LPS O-acetylase OafA/YrhL
MMKNVVGMSVSLVCFVSLWVTSLAAGEIPWVNRLGQGAATLPLQGGPRFDDDGFRQVLSQALDDLNDDASESQCSEDFQLVMLQALDAFGKPGPDIFGGNVHFAGSYDECLDIAKDFMKYCVLSINTTVSLLPAIYMDICIPRSCNLTDILFYLDVANNYLDTNFSLTGEPVCSESKTTPYSAGAIAMIVVCAIFLALAFVGSAVDIGVKTLRNLMNKPEFSRKRDRSYKSEESPLLRGTSDRRGKIFSSRAWENTLEFVTAFSLFKNVPMILSTKQPPTAITSLNGIRVISMFWVILGHTHYWALLTGALTNTAYVLTHFPQRFSFQAIVNAFFAVDSFFFLSGVLVAYLTFREMERKKGRFPFITYYLHRYLRLTMIYAFLLFFWWTLTVHLGSGPLWEVSTGAHSPTVQQCNKYWWTNLLYINNFYPWELGQECMGWSWYLAIDMQLYVLAPLVLIPLYYFFPIGLIISGGLVAVTIAANGAIAGTKNLLANTVISADVRESDDIYIKPYCRAAPYIVGLVLGYVLFKKVRVNIHWFVDVLIYYGMLVVAAGCLFSTVYGLYGSWHGHELSDAENVSYYMFSRFVWGVGLALMVFACHNGYGWVINDFLSMKFWIPLSRLTYAAYLIHPILLTIIFSSNRQPFPYTDYTLAVYAVGMVVLSFGAAGVAAVFVEFPLSNLEMAVFKSIGLKLRESTRSGGTPYNKAHIESPLSSGPINEEDKEDT